MKGKKNRLFAFAKFVLLVAASAVALSIFFVVATDTTLRATFYELTSDKINEAIRLAVLTDLHSCTYGENQAELMKILETQNPDAVLFVGDIFDERFPVAPAVVALSESAKKFPTYYVTGNHEYKKFRGQPRQFLLYKSLARESGACVLQGDCVCFHLPGDLTGSIKICGVDDPLFIGKEGMTAQLQESSQNLAACDFSVLLAHRPELLDTYSQFGFDLIVSGHAHGGQWRLPGLIEGVYSPSQGLFPKYTSGKYFAMPSFTTSSDAVSDNGTTMIVSRGLAKKATSVPRIFNPVEVVIVDLLPAT